MNQTSHTWLAIRALALLEDCGEVPGLRALLRPNVKGAAIGCWIPDLADSKRGFGDIDYHVLKMKPYKNAALQRRFVLKKADLFKKIGDARKVRGFIEDWGSVLDSDWWSTPYKATPKPGQHLANRSKTLADSLVDQLILGDTRVAKLVPGTIDFAKRLDADARTKGEQIATYCFILSHFVADSCQPCHCDARRLYGYSRGLHKELEKHWTSKINSKTDKFFQKSNFLKTAAGATTILEKARQVDEEFDIRFSTKIPKLRADDVWEEIIHVCRASFAVASIIVPPNLIAYSSSKTTTFHDAFALDADSKLLLTDVDRMVLHDAVLNIAIVWKEIWNTFS